MPFEINEFSMLVERSRRIENELNFFREHWDPQVVKHKGFDQKPKFLARNLNQTSNRIQFS